MELGMAQTLIFSTLPRKVVYSDSADEVTLLVWQDGETREVTLRLAAPS